jgi:hypothetical protein
VKVFVGPDSLLMERWQQATQAETSTTPFLCRRIMESGSTKTAGGLATMLNAEEVPPTITVLPRSGCAVEVQTLRRREVGWGAPTPASFASVPNKAALNFEGHPAWAEIVLVRLLERGGWGAAWVKNWGGLAFWRDVNDPIELPQMPSALLQKVETMTGVRGGCWDVFAWRGDDVLFIESKQHRRDRLRPTQKIWLETAIGCDVPLSAFAVVEWDAETPKP